MKTSTFFLFLIVLLASLISIGNKFPLEEKKDIIIVFKKQATHISTSHLKNKNEKGRYVFNLAKNIADNGQQKIILEIEKYGLDYTSYFLVNSISVKSANENFIQRISKFEEVDYVMDDPWIKMEDPIRINTNDYSRTEWGLEKIGVDKVWEMGITGAGAVIGGQDTGYDWRHPALQGNYRGWDGTQAVHDYHWHDAIHDYSPLHGTQENPCGLDVQEPCDDNRHGTHTMGSMIGRTEEIGVAPAAQWMACRNMERGYGRPSTYIECFEWFLAPTDLNGQNPNPDLSPHVINNSWGCPEMEGCTPDNFKFMEQAINRLKAAGVVVVVSAGNGGINGCGTVGAPPAIFENSFSVGASDIEDTLAFFSSKGPVLADGSWRMKPNVTAPGVQVRSCIPNGDYAIFSGTSMAGPHVAGVVALMISANPELAGEVEQIETILERTAVPINSHTNICGETGLDNIPNHIFGWGRIDALAAVKTAQVQAYDFNDENLFVFPNPSKGHFTFLVPGQAGPFNIRIWDASGRLLRIEEKNNLHDSFKLDLSHLSGGVYFYELRESDVVYKGKILKL